jgi:hypothetical protein
MTFEELNQKYIPIHMAVVEATVEFLRQADFRVPPQATRAEVFRQPQVVEDFCREVERTMVRNIKQNRRGMAKDEREKEPIHPGEAITSSVQNRLSYVSQWMGNRSAMNWIDIARFQESLVSTVVMEIDRRIPYADWRPFDTLVEWYGGWAGVF